jgi:NaMN:DMB phosphoribosyltransferase
MRVAFAQVGNFRRAALAVGVVKAAVARHSGMATLAEASAAGKDG